MRLACQIVAFSFLVYALAEAPGHAANPGKPAQPAPAAETPAVTEQERSAAAQEGLSEQDKAFLTRTFHGEMLELGLSKAAIARAKMPAVRRFAATAAQHVGRAQTRLDKVAQEFGMSMPAMPPDDVLKAQQAVVDARDPDREYLLRVLTATERADSLYKEEAGKGQNPVLVQYAREVLPRLTQYYRVALQLSDIQPRPVVSAKHPAPKHKG